MTGVLGAPVLTGVKVLALEHAVAAPLCTRHLADLGATVTKVEPPGSGDFARRYDGAVHGSSSHFTWLNGGKRSLAVDVKTPLGRAVFDHALAASDVFVCNLSPAARERLVPDEVLGRDRPDLIRCYISGYGDDGPYASRKAFDSLIQGESGVLASTGTESAPAKCGISIADVGAGTYAFGLVNAALLRREQHGVGTRIDVALFDVLTYWLSPLLVAQRNGTPPPPPAGGRHATIVPYGTYLTASGTWLNLAVQNAKQWRDLCLTVLDAPDLANDPRWATNEVRALGRAELEPRIEAILAGLDEREVIRRLEMADVPWGRVNGIDEVSRHPQLLERDRWVPIAVESGATAEVLAAPFGLDAAVGAATRVPALGEHTASVMAELGFAEAEIDEVLGANEAVSGDG